MFFEFHSHIYQKYRYVRYQVNTKIENPYIWYVGAKGSMTRFHHYLMQLHIILREWFSDYINASHRLADSSGKKSAKGTEIHIFGIWGIEKLSKCDWYSFSGVSDMYIELIREWGHSYFLRIFSSRKPLPSTIPCTKLQFY